jgi:hypothetical protein
LYALVWSADLGPSDARHLADRLALRGWPGATVRGWPATCARLNRLRNPSPSAFAALGLSEEEVVAAAVCSRHAATRAAARRQLSQPAPLLTIRGADLLQAGVPPGPAIGKALAATLAARMDGTISSEQELSYALKAAGKNAPRR